MAGLRLYVDEDSQSHAIIEQLRRRDIDVTSVDEQRRRGVGDAEQLAFAVTAGRVMLTKNIGDFRRLHNAYVKSEQHHCGIILIGSPYFEVGVQIRGILALENSLSMDDMRDRVEFLSNWLS